MGAAFYPCLTLIDWVPPFGGNARYWGLKLMIDVLGSEFKKVVAVNVSSSTPAPEWWPTRSIVYAAAFVRSDGRRLVLLANTNSSAIAVQLQGAAHAQVHVVDFEHGHGDVPYSNDTLSSEGQIELGPLAVALVEMSEHPARLKPLKSDDEARVALSCTFQSNTDYLTHGPAKSVPATPLLYTCHDIIVYNNGRIQTILGS